MTWVNPVYQTPCCKRTWNPGEDARGPIFWNEYTEQVQCRICCKVFVMAAGATEPAEDGPAGTVVEDEVQEDPTFAGPFTGFGAPDFDPGARARATVEANEKWKRDRGLA